MKGVWLDFGNFELLECGCARISKMKKIKKSEKKGHLMLAQEQSC